MLEIFHLLTEKTLSIYFNFQVSPPGLLCSVQIHESTYKSKKNQFKITTVDCVRAHGCSKKEQSNQELVTSH